MTFQAALTLKMLCIRDLRLNFNTEVRIGNGSAHLLIIADADKYRFTIDFIQLEINYACLCGLDKKIM